jgi:hypothetical protein
MIVSFLKMILKRKKIIVSNNMAIEFNVSTHTFNRDIKCNGTELVIKTSQYYSTSPVSVSTVIKSTPGEVHTEDKCVLYEMKIPIDGCISSEIAKVVSSARSKYPRITGHRLPVKKSVLFLTTESIVKGKFYNADGSIAPDGYKLMTGPCQIIVELRISSITVIKGILHLDINLKRCVFIQADKNAKIQLTLPGQRPHVPPHFMAVFNQSRPEDRQCPICRDVIDTDLYMSKCFHFFHGCCMSLYDESTCPVCRCVL